MMKYGELLPNYLNGVNINRHGDIITDEDNKILFNNNILNYFLKKPPIMIQQTSYYMEDYSFNLMVELDEFIKDINVSVYSTEDNTLLYGDVIEFDEEEQILNYTNEIILEGITHELPFIFYITVEIVTYNENRYVKSYPENDISNGSDRDHFILLDIVGNLCNIPRRIYKSFNLSRIDYTYPHTVGKDVVGGVVQSCTEDDFDYYQRLHYFIMNYQTVDAITVIAKVFYSVSAVFRFKRDDDDVIIYECGSNPAPNIQQLPLGVDLREIEEFKPYTPITQKVLTRYRGGA